jgi:hypothetical protein
MCTVCHTHCRSNGTTTGPPPNIIVPARYMLEKRLNRIGRYLMTPRNTIMVMNVTKNPTMRRVPNLQDTFNSRSTGIALGSCISFEVVCISFGAVGRYGFPVLWPAGEPCCLAIAARDDTISAVVTLHNFA